MSSRSNDNGRVLEAILTIVLSRELNVPLSDEARVSQIRDSEKINEIDEPMKGRFESQSVKLLSWFLSKDVFSPADVLEIHRFSDADAKKGNVTDVQIRTKKGPINISVKHNHSATKHQRPGTVILRMGLGKNSICNLEYLAGIKQITDDFYERANILMPLATKFRELKAADAEFINRECYLPFCSLINQYYKKFEDNAQCASALFTFLVGSTDFYKVQFNHLGLCIYNFKDIVAPRKFTSQIKEGYPSYVYLQFDNAWEFSLRLHTASSRLGTSLSLKFDTQLSNLPIPAVRL